MQIAASITINSCTDPYL